MRALRISRMIPVAFICIICLSGCAHNRDFSGIKIENSDSVIRTIRSTMLNRSAATIISFDARTLDEKGIERTADKLIKASFYESDDPKGGDYLRYQYGGYELRYKTEKKLFKYRYTLRISPVYYTDKKMEQKVDELIPDIIGSLALDEDAGDQEKVRAVCDLIKDTVEYDTVHMHQPGDNHIQYTAYGALIYHTALCQGYAVLCYRLLKELNVDTRVVTGTTSVLGQDMKHAWNIVRIDDKYYNLDITLDDVRGGDEYFLRSDAAFEKDHTRDDEFLTDDFIRAYPISTEDHSG